MTWEKENLWDTLLAPLERVSNHKQTGVIFAPVMHGFSADIVLPRNVKSVGHSHLPKEGSFLSQQDLRIACLTPHHYLLSSTNTPKADALSTLFGDDYSMIEQSGSRATLLVSGPSVQDCLRRGIVIDLDPSAFPVTAFASTYAGHINIHIFALRDTQYEISCPRSMAGSFWHWLSKTAAPFGMARSAI